MPLPANILDRLERFAIENKFDGQGPLALALVVTEKAFQSQLPLDSEALLTPSRTQVAGLSGRAANKILREYEIEPYFGTESGRTSRGIAEKMKTFVSFLNEISTAPGFSIEEVPNWWAERTKRFYFEMPFKLSFDESKSVQAIFSDLVNQAIERQKLFRGATYAGTVLQHLVGAKLEMLSTATDIEHHGANVADAPSARAGDFLIKDTVIHVTTSPSSNLITKCAENLRAGLRPMIITTRDGARGGENAARIEGIDDRLEIIEFEQFMAINVYEKAGFSSGSRRGEIEKIITRYNKIIDAVESLPSLKILIS